MGAYTMIFATTVAVVLLLPTRSSALEPNGQVTLQYQLGPYPVHISNYELQTQRNDPLAPSPMKRRLALSIFQPLTSISECADPSVQPYMPNLTAQEVSVWLTAASIPQETISRLQLPQCGSPYPSSDPDYDSTPLILFSTGSMGPRFLYQTISPAVASAGYTVILVDHTYDAFVVEFAGAETTEDLVRNNYPPEYANYTIEERNEFLGNVATIVRSDDITSVLDAVEAGEIPGIENFTSDKGSLKAGIFGHSLGGATAASAIVRDERIAGGINLDGGVFRNDVQSDKPFVTMSSQSTFASDPLVINDTVSSHYDQLQGYKRWVYVSGSAHNSFSDFNKIIDTLDIRNEIPPEAVDTIFGPILGPRIQQIVYNYTVDFFDMILKGEGEGLWSGPSEEFDEIVFLRSDN